MREVETTILDIEKEDVAKKMEQLGAELILDTRFIVDWFRPIGVREGEDPWFLRIRTTKDGVSTATWKGLSNVVGTTRQHQEVNCRVENPEHLGLLFEAIGLERYAHQEKDRVSWKLHEWRFDLDQYPGMPPYLEIEGSDEPHVAKAITLLGLEKHRTAAVGERILIQEWYGLDWYDMRFPAHQKIT